MARRLQTPADPGVLRQLHQALDRADFTVAAISGLLDGEETTTLKSHRPRMLYATRGAKPLDAFIRLFVLGVPVPVEQAEEAFEPVPVSTLCEIGVLRNASGSVAPLISILPHGDLVIASDQAIRSGRSRDYVPGVQDSSVFLELFAVRRPIESALDLGAGCGIHALCAAPHTRKVAALDLSRRALDFARFNAALNGFSNIEFFQGNGFEPLAGRRFDLIVGNLPFVITPSTRYIYRDSGVKLDGFAKTMISQAPAHLTEGGFCQLLCQWIEFDGEDWQDRLRTWFDGSGCDVWIMKNDSRAPDAYAEKWIADTEPNPPEGVDRLFELWMEFYENERIAAIHSGAIAMRRRNGSNWIRMDDSPAQAVSPFGNAVLRAFAVGDYLQTATDQSLLDACFRTSPDIHMIQRCDSSSGAWRIEACQLRFHRELQYIANVDELVSKLVARCTGDRKLTSLIDELARQAAIPAERLRPACLQLVRGLVERGFVLPES